MNGSILLVVLEQLNETVRTARDLRSATADPQQQALLGAAQDVVSDCQRQISKLIQRAGRSEEVQRLVAKHFGS